MSKLNISNATIKVIFKQCAAPDENVSALAENANLAWSVILVDKGPKIPLSTLIPAF